jgi:hypothetical protein
MVMEAGLESVLSSQGISPVGRLKVLRPYQDSALREGSAFLLLSTLGVGMSFYKETGFCFAFFFNGGKIV